MVRSQGRLADFLLLLRRSNMFIALSRPDIALLRSAMFGGGWSYKHIAPTEQKHRGSLGLTPTLSRAYSPEYTVVVQKVFDRDIIHI
jgi:hypothetical protein